jgi:hypothetical protein
MTDIYMPAGVDITATPTTAQFGLGQCAKGADSTEWVYVQASGVIRQYDVVAIDEDFTARAVTSALAGAGHKAGFAQVAFADNDFGWIATRGSNIQINAASSCAADALLYVGSTGLSAGVVDDASLTGRVTLQGVVLVTANASSTTTGLECIATCPIFLNV